MVNKMIRNISILCIALGIMTSACTDWLTVQPKTTIVAENLYTTDDGVEQALNGMYILMRTRIYQPDGIMGGAGFAEGLAATWTQAGNAAADLSSHVYNLNNADVASLFNNSFMTLYSIISNATPLIDGLEENRALLSEEVYNIVKGEALAIRACIHLDLIRLWGPMPTKVNAGMRYLPYVTEYSTEKYMYHTYEEYMRQLFADLDEAEELLSKSDPILEYHADNTAVGTTKWLQRQSRFNYYGVLGLQARAHLWYGDRDEALRYAKLVIDAKNLDGTSKFVLGDLALLNSFGDGETDYTLYPEHLCGMDVELYDYTKGSFGTSTPVSMIGMTYAFQELFDYNTNDIRFSRMWYSFTRPFPAVFCIKYQGLYPTSRAKATNMPIVRLAEMYLAVMECGTLEEANAANQEFCLARNINYVPFTEADRQERVLKEYIRELMAEGQNFFTYKRNEVARMFNQPAESLDCDEEQYVLPLPPKEF